MSKRLQSVVSAAITILIFTALPMYAPGRLPLEIEAIISQTGLDLAGFINQIAVIGVVIAFLTLVKGFAAKHSPTYLLASVASSTMMLAFTTISLSLGEWGNLGVSTISIDFQGVKNTVVLDLSLFVQLAVLSVALEVVHSILEFADARKEKLKPLTQLEPHSDG